jgi:phosphatidylinositol alpha 1,6-mannosyltransferase
VLLPVQPNEIRVALFSGNYNYVRDGANQALNRLVGYLLRQGVQVRVYSPTTDTPAFEPTGDLVSIKSVPIPGREEYRLGLGLGAEI